jgi:HSP20 family molecular chaperone IbpA
MDQSLQYAIPVPDGDYTLTLHLADIYARTQKVGGRVFNVSIEGSVIFENLDIFSEVGGFAALKKTTTVHVSDGILTIEFIKKVDNPKISGIEIHASWPATTPQSAAQDFVKKTFTPIHINTGGKAFIDSTGITWEADAYYNAGGIYKTGPEQKIEGTVDEGLYKSERWAKETEANLKYQIPVPYGEYVTTLHFADIYAGTHKVGGRVFDVSIEGTVELANVDIFSEVGGFAALTKSVTKKVTDGVLTIEFIRKVQSPTIAGIEVRSVSSSSLPQVETGPEPAPVAAQPLIPPIRINAGGDAFTDSTGTTWAADAYYVNGQTYQQKQNEDISGTVDDSLFRSERYDKLSDALKYEIPIRNGEYSVTLYFADLYAGTHKVGARVFDVSLEGSVVFPRLDIFAEAGGFAALNKTASTKVTDGVLTLELLRDVENPNLSAIEIIDLSEVEVLRPAVDTTPAAEFTPIYINAGGPKYRDSNGTTWAADQYFNTGVAYETGENIIGTKDQALYRTERYDKENAPELMYEIPVPNGNYLVTLHFSENYSKMQKKGSRIFDVLIEGYGVFKDLDIFSEVGGFAPLTRSAPATVSDGVLTIEFLAVIENPKISAIAVEAIESGKAHHAHAVPGGPYFTTDTDGDNVASVVVDGTFSHSHGVGAELVSWKWKVGDKLMGTGEVMTVELPVGVHQLVLEVADTDGAISSDFTTVTIMSSVYAIISSLSPASTEVSGG